MDKGYIQYVKVQPCESFNNINHLLEDKQYQSSKTCKTLRHLEDINCTSSCVYCKDIVETMKQRKQYSITRIWTSDFLII